MPNQRSKDQKLVNFPARESFIALIEDGVKLAASGDRSKFIRDAIVDKLRRLGIPVPPEVFSPPSRTGKSSRLPDRQMRDMVLSQESSSKPPSVSKALAKKASASAQRRDAK